MYLKYDRVFIPSELHKSEYRILAEVCLKLHVLALGVQLQELVGVVLLYVDVNVFTWNQHFKKLLLFLFFILFFYIISLKKYTLIVTKVKKAMFFIELCMLMMFVWRDIWGFVVKLKFDSRQMWMCDCFVNTIACMNL